MQCVAFHLKTILNNISECNREPGARIGLWDNNGGNNQMWDFEYQEGAPGFAGGFSGGQQYPVGGYPGGQQCPGGGYPGGQQYPVGGYPGGQQYPVEGCAPGFAEPG